MLAVVVFWLTMVFLSVSIISGDSPNATVITTLFLCALSVAGADLLVLELDQPFGGLIQISSAPMRRRKSSFWENDFRRPVSNATLELFAT